MKFYTNQTIAVIIVAIIIVTLAILLNGCTTTKTVEVPVPLPCTKPKNMPVPHDYMADLTLKSTPPEFVKACLATRESYKNAYNACAFYHGG